MLGLKSVKVFQPEPKFEGYGAGALCAPAPSLALKNETVHSINQLATLVKGVWPFERATRHLVRD